jgi:S-DNA-T family DNA segregation ATPase FtsK/SpoIIIE
VAKNKKVTPKAKPAAKKPGRPSKGELQARAEKKRLQKILIAAFITTLIMLVGIFQLGLLGVTVANLMSFAFGETYIIAAVAIIFGWAIQVINIGKFRPKLSMVIGIICLTLGITLALEIIMFIEHDIDAPSLMTKTLEFLIDNLKTFSSAHHTGGGLIGAGLFHITYVLLALPGTIGLAIILLFTGIYNVLPFKALDLKGKLGAVIDEKEQARESAMEQKEARLRELVEQEKAQELHEAHKKEQARLEEEAREKAMRAGDVWDARDYSGDGFAGDAYSAEQMGVYASLTGVTSYKPDDMVPSFYNNDTEYNTLINTNFFDEDSILNSQHLAGGVEIVEAHSVLEDTMHDFEVPEELRQVAAAPVAEVEPDNGPVEDVQLKEYDEPEKLVNYKLPSLALLDRPEKIDMSSEHQNAVAKAKVLEDTLRSFGVEVRVVDMKMGPSVTKYELQPAVGVKVSRITSLADDISLALAAKDVRIEAPIPGKPLVGIEVPNATTASVTYFETIADAVKNAHGLLEVPLGRDVSGRVRCADLTKMPHLLVAGSTGSGKSVCINTIITSILMKAKPNEVKMLMIDPKMVELSMYNDIGHLMTPVVTNAKKAAGALQKVVAKMEERYELFATTGTRNIEAYNSYINKRNMENGEDYATLPYIVVIVDELADLMMASGNQVEDAIIRLAQKARAAGIHMILATQRPSVDVITGLIKANVPSRIAFAVSSGVDSRTILDMNGAEKLLGRGDMLFMPIGENKPIRIQGAFIGDDEVGRVVDFVKSQHEVQYMESMEVSEAETTAGNSSDGSSGEYEQDELFEEAKALFIEQQKASTSLLQRKFRVGYNRAARIVDELEEAGIISPAIGNKPREVLVGKNEQLSLVDDAEAEY